MGYDLPEDSPPPEKSTANPTNPWEPFTSRAHFELADFIFTQNRMSEKQTDDLMHIWAAMPGQKGPPPFRNHSDLHHTIDAIPEGGPPWQCLSLKHEDVDAENVPPWKKATYEVLFADPQALLDQQLANPAFDGHVDYAPYKLFGEQHQRVWSDFMSGNWAWEQCVSKFSGNFFNNLIV